MLGWIILSLAATALALPHEATVAAPLKSYEIICSECNSLGVKRCLAGAGGRLHIAFLSPPFEVSCDVTVKKECKDEISSCAGTTLPPKILNWEAWIHREYAELGEVDKDGIDVGH